MFPTGFLGTRADLFIDIGTVSLVVVVPLLIWSWRLARTKQWTLHKRVQLTMGAVLGIVVIIFEWDLSAQGGIMKLAEASSYAGTFTLKFWLYFHTLFAIASSVVWLLLISLSLLKFPKPPDPRAFRTHRYWGRLGMICMLVAGLTSVPMYIYVFAL
jgi:uncharacterized membrane protein YozB (DUF420 family)